MWLLGSQVLSEAAGTGLKRRVRGAVAEWATTTIHLAAVRDVARVFTEQVLAQVLARTRGAFPSEKDVYRLAAPNGESVEEEDLGTFQAGLQHALADPVARVPSTPSTDSDVQGCSAAAATGHEHDAAGTVGVVHSPVVPPRSRRDGKCGAESAQRDRLGDSRHDSGTPPARRKTDATAPVGHVSQHGPGG